MAQQYVKTIILRLIWIILSIFFMASCSHELLTRPEKTPVAADKMEEQILTLGEQHFNRGEFESALQKTQEALKLNPDNVEALYATADVYLALGQYNKSLEFSKRAAAYKSERLPDIYLLIGKTYQRHDDPWNALRTYRFAVSEYPKNSKLQYSLGDTYAYLNKAEFAADAFKAAILADPRNAASHFQLGVLYYSNDYSTPALLSLSVSLLLKPKQASAPLIIKDINDLLGREVVTRKTDEGDFRSVDEALVRQRMSLLNKSETYTAFEIIKAQYHTLFKELNTLKIKNKNNAFVMDNYVPLYDKVQQEGLDEAFVYYVFQGSKNTVISNWLEKHPEKIKQLEQVVRNYKG